MMNIRTVCARARLVCLWQARMGDTQDRSDGAHQATCSRCARSSPVLRTTEEAALAALAELGWTRSSEGLHLCPICRDRAKPLRPQSRAD
jgi:hypothetical protein